MIEIRPISDLTYNLPEIEKAVEQGKQVFLTRYFDTCKSIKCSKVA